MNHWCCAAVFVALSICSCAHADLRQVVVVTRHGARTPYYAIPHDLQPWDCRLTALELSDYTEEALETIPRLYRKLYLPGRQVLPGNCTQGALTFQGWQNHQALGNQFRMKYVDQLGFLDAQFDPKEVYVRSTDVPRTMKSAESQLLALFPPPTRSQSQIVDIFTVEPPMEDISPNNRCPVLVNFCNQLQQSSLWTARAAKLDPLKHKLQALWNITTWPGWIDVFDALYSRKYHDMPLPVGVTEGMMHEITELAIWQISYLYAQPNVVKLAIGSFIGEIQDRITNMVKGNAEAKWVFYSAHDTTIALILSGLEVFNNVTEWPPYAAHIVMEIGTQDGTQEWFVQVLYNDVVLELPGCGATQCPLGVFQSILDQLIPANWAQECFSIPPVAPVGDTLYFC